MAFAVARRDAEKVSLCAGLTLAEIGALASRPFVGMEEEPSELERLCLEVRAQLEALSEDEDDAEVDASSTDTDEECLMQAGRYPCEASNEIAAKDGQDGTSSSRMSSGTLYNGSGSYEMSFHGNARFSGNVMGDTSRCRLCLWSHSMFYSAVL